MTSCQLDTCLVEIYTRLSVGVFSCLFCALIWLYTLWVEDHAPVVFQYWDRFWSRFQLCFSVSTLVLDSLVSCVYTSSAWSSQRLMAFKHTSARFAQEKHQRLAQEEQTTRSGKRHFLNLIITTTFLTMRTRVMVRPYFICSTARNHYHSQRCPWKSSNWRFKLAISSFCFSPSSFRRPLLALFSILRGFPTWNKSALGLLKI